MKKKDGEAQSELRKMEERILHEFRHHTGALIEHFQSGLSAVAEQYLSLNKKVDVLGNKVDTLDHKADALDTKVSVLENKVGGLEEKADETLDILRANQETLIEHDRAIKEIQHERN